MCVAVSLSAEDKDIKADPVLELTTAPTASPEQSALSWIVAATFFPENKFDALNLGDRLSWLVCDEFKESTGTTKFK